MSTARPSALSRHSGSRVSGSPMSPKVGASSRICRCASIWPWRRARAALPGPPGSSPAGPAPGSLRGGKAAGGKGPQTYPPGRARRTRRRWRSWRFSRSCLSQPGTPGRTAKTLEANNRPLRAARSRAGEVCVRVRRHGMEIARVSALQPTACVSSAAEEKRDPWSPPWARYGWRSPGASCQASPTRSPAR